MNLVRGKVTMFLARPYAFLFIVVLLAIFPNIPVLASSWTLNDWGRRRYVERLCILGEELRVGRPHSGLHGRPLPIFNSWQ